MLKALVIAAALALPVTAHAQNTAENCAQFGQLAESIMTARQNNVPMSRLMEIANDASPDGAAMMRAIVVYAYQQPIFLTDDFRREAIATFRNEAELACYGRGA